ncbi:hypothetical protein D4764_15G0013590 [Takifugu flavidus]|uniref:Uncharacterized protein n=1 Tax=Takifugu flavidus TaxID=433684 RepID=A0A5C6P349_9TELE|nr:hypothetical protein D4764_15G0013590 [Takifugu flavidus]
MQCVKGVTETTWSKPEGGAEGGATVRRLWSGASHGAQTWGPRRKRGKRASRQKYDPSDFNLHEQQEGDASSSLKTQEPGSDPATKEQATPDRLRVPQGSGLDAHWTPATKMPINFTVVPVEDAEGGASSAAAAGGTKADISVPTVVVGEDGDRFQGQDSVPHQGPEGSTGVLPSSSL